MSDSVKVSDLPWIDFDETDESGDIGLNSVYPPSSFAVLSLISGADITEIEVAVTIAIHNLKINLESGLQGGHCLLGNVPLS